MLIEKTAKDALKKIHSRKLFYTTIKINFGTAVFICLILQEYLARLRKYLARSCKINCKYDLARRSIWIKQVLFRFLQYFVNFNRN